MTKGDAANVSAELVWMCTRKHSAFKRTNSAATKQKGVNKIYLSAERGNLTARNSFKYSGLANVKSLDIRQGENHSKGQIEFQELVQPDLLMFTNDVPAKFNAADTNRDGHVSFKEFCDIYMKMTGLPPPRSHVVKFRKCDKDKSGNISMSEFLKFQMGGHVDYSMENSQLTKMNRVVIKNTGNFRPDLQKDALRRVTAVYKANRKAKALAKASA